MGDAGRARVCAPTHVSLVLICVIPCALIVGQSDLLTEGKLLFSRVDKGTGIEEIYRIGISGGDEVRLTSDSTALSNSQPRWSPDGRSVAFVRSIGFDQSQIMLMDADGENLRSITRLGRWPKILLGLRGGLNLPIGKGESIQRIPVVLKVLEKLLFIHTLIIHNGRQMGARFTAMLGCSPMIWVYRKETFSQ